MDINDHKNRITRMNRNSVITSLTCDDMRNNSSIKKELLMDADGRSSCVQIISSKKWCVFSMFWTFSIFCSLCWISVFSLFLSFNCLFWMYLFFLEILLVLIYLFLPFFLSPFYILSFLKKTLLFWIVSVFAVSFFARKTRCFLLLPVFFQRVGIEGQESE